MGAELDLHDVAEGHPLAERELEELRARAEKAEAEVKVLREENARLREALALAGEIRCKVESIERCEEWTDGEPTLGTCRTFGRIKQIADQCAALVGKGE